MMASVRIGVPTLPRPPDQYNKEYVERLVRSLEQALNTLYNISALRCATINISQLPTTSVGLKSGDVWNDSGTLKIV